MHLWGRDAPEIADYLLFRDQLRRSPEDRATYEQVERELADRDWPDVNHPADAKSDVVAAIVARASSSP